MPLTHDIGVRIPYPLLKTDNFGCLFFFVYMRVLCKADENGFVSSDIRADLHR